MRTGYVPSYASQQKPQFKDLLQRAQDMAALSHFVLSDSNPFGIPKVNYGTPGQKNGLSPVPSARKTLSIQLAHILRASNATKEIYPSFPWNFKATELIQYLRPVGGGPSSNT